VIPTTLGLTDDNENQFWNLSDDLCADYRIDAQHKGDFLRFASVLLDKYYMRRIIV
jgi:hypothetical protein